MKYTVFQSPLGSVLVAASERGITWMGFGDSDEEALAEIRLDFPTAELMRAESDRELRRYSAAILAFLERRFSFPTLPLDLIGTPFQRRVWDELCAIPHGTTRSYGEIARLAGRPDAPRAVGAAVGANPVSILVPCHRAVAADGSLHNYRYGIERKRALLDIEGVPLRHGRDLQRRLSLGRAG
jgi:O-6-methylguanine DNA methyltransferase